MKFTKQWLDELTEFEIGIDKLVDQITMVGLEVDSVTPVAGKFSNVVVGKILEVERHPNADKLSICKLDVDKGEILSIVCGAKNVRADLKVAVALVGAVLPGDFKIKKAKLRGVNSTGMICSASELGLDMDSSGIIELPEDAPIGKDIREYLKLEDSLVEVELTANRGDCLSITGIAREVAAINRIHLAPIKIPEFKNNSDIFDVAIKAKDACPYYSGRIIRGVNNKVETPLWIQERLRRLGEKCINPIVDITNYVMYELGQPTHAFNLEKLDKKINVRYAQRGEKLKLLDKTEVELKPTDIVISDNNKAVALGGVMGGMDSGVYEDTTDIFLESAYFVPEKLHGIARSYGLQTGSSYRFERGVDYKLQLKALNRVTDLILKIAGGVPSGITEIVEEKHLPQNRTIELNAKSINRVLGISIDDKEVMEILEYLGMDVELINGGWRVIPPSWRFDIKIKEDLIEEIARIHGYDKVVEQPITTELNISDGICEREKFHKVYGLMEGLGYNEIITYSFVDKKIQELLSPNIDPISLSNPISSELSVMRTNLWPGLISAIKYNFKRQQQRARIFETGLKFFKDGDKLEQVLTISGALAGELYPKQWGIDKKDEADFFDAKNTVASILKVYGYDSEVRYVPKSHDSLHPLRSAEIFIDERLVGSIGQLHPLVKQKLGLTKQITLFEIDLSNIINKKKVKLKNISKFPKIQRDIAITISKDIPWFLIKQKIVDILGELLDNCSVFDVYSNENIGLDKHSMAIHLEFQSVDRTLVDDEVDQLINKVILMLKQSFNASLRG